MAVFHIILRHLPGILGPFFIQEIHRVGFLKQRIAFIFLVGQYAPDVAFIPLGPSMPVRDPISRKVTCDQVNPLAIQKLAVDSADDFRLLFIVS
jgi:hypothetical protein